MFEAKGILSYFTRHATIANLMVMVLLAAGLLTFPNMRTQFFPDVVTETVNVTASWDGAGAEDVDAAIVQLMEPNLLAVEGVESVDSRSFEGRARITMEFEPGWDVSRAAEDVQSAIDEITDLPDDADTPTVRRSAWRDGVTDVIVSGPVGIEQLALFIDEMVIRLFEQGVTRTTIRGVAAPQTVVEVTSLSLIQYDVTMSEIASAIAGEVSADPAGDVAAGAARVRTGTAKRSVDQIEAIVLRTNDDGSELTIGDVATIYIEGVDRNRAYYVGDDRAVTMNVSRSSQGDAIEIQEIVEEIRAEMLLTLPDGVNIELMRTRSELISARIRMLTENGAQGLALVLLLLFLFLNARTAFWVAAGIPVAMSAALFIMYMAGLTINMISLFALIITLGIVVDDAIVVGEHADFRARRLGESPVVAAENAAKRMFAPVFSATLTTIIAFFGITAIGGRFGDMIMAIPFTVVAVLLASLVECFLILPHHMAHALTHTAKEHWYDWPSRQVNKGFRWFRDTAFRPMMGLVVRARYPVFAAAVFILASQLSVFIRGDITFRFFNAPERSTITGNFAMVAGATREDTLEMMRLVQSAVEATSDRFETEHGRDPVLQSLSQIGGNAGRGLSGVDTKDEELLGSVSVELIDADLRSYELSDFVSELQQNVENHPLLEILSFRGGRFGPGGDSIDVQLFGATAEQLKSASEALQARLSRFTEVSALEDSLSYDKEELVLDLTPQGKALGFTIDSLGKTLRQRLNGIEAATYPDGTRSAEIRVELSSDELTADFLDRMQLRAPSGEYVNLSDLVSVASRSGFASVQRENGIRLISMTGDIDESDPARADEIQRTLEEQILPEIAETFSVTYKLSGLAEQQRDFLSDAQTGLIMALLGIFLSLAWIFSSWTRPFVVMAVIPFGLVGAIFGHVQWGVPLSMFSIVGLIGMTGIIINDSIVLVTTIDQYARERGLIPAIIDGTADRLRPVLLTTLTTVLGLMPLLYEGSRQAEFLKPTVITLTYGLGFGMFLVLLVVPAFIAMQADVQRMTAALKRIWHGRGRKAMRPALAVVGLAAALVVLAFALCYYVWGLTPEAVLWAVLASAGISLIAYIAAALTTARSQTPAP